jgi:uncharacterized protein YjbI with pentapeptide repeats
VTDPRLALRADCARCSALCCVVPALAASADFAIDKPAGAPCPNLQPDFRCSIHAELRERGFPGCTAYDCFGAGQQVTQVTFAGTSWRASPETAEQVFAVFPIMRQLHELLWYLADALSRPAARTLHGRLREAYDQIARATRDEPRALRGLDVAALRSDVNELLLGTSELVRAEVPSRRADHRGADLIGARLVGADLRGADLRGAYLLGADLRRADLRWADLIGADLRGADVGGADLRESLFLTQSQVGAASGDGRTALPGVLDRPRHWSVDGNHEEPR